MRSMHSPSSRGAGSPPSSPALRYLDTACLRQPQTKLISPSTALCTSSSVDWREQAVEIRFLEALAFRWASRPSVDTATDDSTYEVVDSVWLLDEIRLESPANPEDFAHYVLCF